MKKALITFAVAVVFVLGNRTASDARDLNSVIGLIPPHAEIGADDQPQGGFVEVVEAIDRVYLEGRIAIKVLPIARAMSNLLNGQAEFFIPYIPSPHIPPATLPFAYATETIVEVSFVLFTHADNPVPPMDNLESFQIETLRGAALHFPFKISEIDSFKQGVLRVANGRSYGFIAEQDGTDKFIRDNKIKTIRRTLYATWQSAVVIPKGPEGEEINRIISGALRQLKKSGELTKIAATIHRPFSDWQPYLMDW